MRPSAADSGEEWLKLSTRREGGRNFLRNLPSLRTVLTRLKR